MTISITHPFVSLKGDGGDATLIRPSNWNANHTTSIATQKVVGRLTAGTGAFEEISLTSYMATLLAAVDNATLAGLLGIFETGDCKWTFKTTASAGWVLLLGGAGSQVATIGSGGSGAVLRANADTANLYSLIWSACDNTIAPIYDSAGSATTRGANAAADFAANKRLTIPNPVGKALITAGAATNQTAPTSARTLGITLGEENHLLTTAEIPTHNHPVFLNDPGHTHGVNMTNIYTANVGGNLAGGSGAGTQNLTITSATTGITVRDTTGGGGTANQTATTGGGGSHNNIQPSIALNCMVKL